MRVYDTNRVVLSTWQCHLCFPLRLNIEKKYQPEFTCINKLYTHNKKILKLTILAFIFIWGIIKSVSNFSIHNVRFFYAIEIFRRTMKIGLFAFWKIVNIEKYQIKSLNNDIVHQKIKFILSCFFLNISAQGCLIYLTSC